MFRQKVKSIAELLPEFLRNQGLETPLQQRRLIDSWETVVGAPIAAYCGEKFIKNHITLIGCPKLDAVDYSEKLTQIIANNEIQSVTIVRMEVPCCGGIEMAAKKALQASGKFIQWQVVTIGIDGTIKED